MKNDFTSEKVGIFGESICAKYLKKHGFKILSKNTRINRLEMDIIATNKTHIAFVEVKTRRTDMKNTARPSAAVDISKKENLVAFSITYSKTLPKKHSEKQIRIDVCEILVHQEKNKLLVDDINYIENAVSR